MVKTFVLGIFLIVIVSCRDDKALAISDNDSLFEIVTEDWPKKAVANTKTTEVVKGWEEFNALQISLDAIYNIGNTEDLSLVLEDLLEKQKTLEESEYPETFDKPQIKSRQKVFHTFILKAKGDLIYRIDTKKSVVEMIEAHNDMLTQMNSITSNTLDLKTLLEEE